MTPTFAKRLRILAAAVGVLVVLLLAAGGWFYSRMRASLPQLDGSVNVPGLAAAVTIERDALGVPTIRAGSRTDVSRALGWIHAQDRFFQMDVLRRRGGGELAELFGKGALPLDRATRMHSFHQLAEKVVAQLPPAQREQLEAYAAGVNAGLAALKTKPFEYYVLRETPRPWQPTDSILVHCAMTLDLQDGNAVYERSLAVLRERLGRDGVEFFAPLVTPDDGAVDGTKGELAPPLSPRFLNLHRRTAAAPVVHPPALHPGSNSFALAGEHTANGSGLLANDMHLDHAVPNTWYRASLEWPGHKITGVTLPGAPLVIVGSNGRVAWGFTNSNIDTSDIVIIEVDTISPLLYLTPNRTELQQLEVRNETIRVKGEAPVGVAYQWSQWGPIIYSEEKKRPLAMRWTAHDPSTVNLSLMELEDAKTAAEAVAIAHHTGIPAQNFLVADSAGKIAWTIAGFVPKRVGFDGRLPVSWAFGDRRWDGYLAPDDVPVRWGDAAGNPALTGRLWSANQRMVGGAMLEKLGDGRYARPPRAMQIRDDLAKIEHATPKDLLAVQLDDRAVFLERWQKRLLATLTPESIAQKKSRGELRAAVEKWDGRATVDSVSYRLVRNFHDAVSERVFGPIFEKCEDDYPAFNWHLFNVDAPLNQLVEQKPMNLLTNDYASWDALLLAAADDVIAGLAEKHVPIAHATWGQTNRLRGWHPFSYSLPKFLTRGLNLPTDPLPGDSDMPRLQLPNHGASERIVVSPGHEAEGIFHMPGGQSGHPLSPYFRAGHEAWVRGEATSFLPGKTEHTLTLRP